MNEYIERIIRCGISAHEAYRLWYTFMKEFSQEELTEFIDSMERECYVARV